MIKKALGGIVYMQIIILHRRYAIKQNESVGFVKSKTLCFYFGILKPNRFQKGPKKKCNMFFLALLTINCRKQIMVKHKNILVIFLWKN